MGATRVDQLVPRPWAAKRLSVSSTNSFKPSLPLYLSPPPFPLLFSLCAFAGCSQSLSPLTLFVSLSTFPLAVLIMYKYCVPEVLTLTSWAQDIPHLINHHPRSLSEVFRLWRAYLTRFVTIPYTIFNVNHFVFLIGSYNNYQLQMNMILEILRSSSPLCFRFRFHFRFLLIATLYTHP